MKKIRLTILILGKVMTRYARKILFRFKREKSFSDFRTTPSKNSKALHLANQKIVLLGILAVLLLGFLIGISSRLKHKNTISEGLVGVYTKDNLPPVVTNLLSEPLISLDRSGMPQPKVASEWQTDEKVQVYKVKLRDNLKWNDQTGLKSFDLRFNLPDVEVSYPDQTTIEFKLADSFTPFPTLLTDPLFKEGSLIGLGKFRVAQEESSHNLLTKLVLVPVSPNDNYPQVIIRFYPDEKTAQTAFELGEVESLVGLSEGEGLINQPSVMIKRMTNFNKIVAIFYNTSKELFSDKNKNFRKALSFATPSIEGEERAKTPIPQHSWAYNDQIKGYLNDPHLVQSYLSKAGTTSATPIVLTTTPVLMKIGERIVQSWNKAGIAAVLRVEGGIPQDFQALLITQSIPSDPDQYALWHSTQQLTNLSKYSFARVDKDLEDGRRVTDIAKRKEKYLDFQKVLVEDSPATFLYFPKTQVIYRKKSEELLNKILPFQIPHI